MDSTGNPQLDDTLVSVLFLKGDSCDFFEGSSLFWVFQGKASVGFRRCFCFPACSNVQCLEFSLDSFKGVFWQTERAVILKGLQFINFLPSPLSLQVLTKQLMCSFKPFC